MNATIHGRFEDHARIAPDRVAVVAGPDTLTYAELNRRANRVAWRLRELGVGAETPVGISVGRSAEMIVGLLAILKAGGAYVPLDPGYPGERLAAMLADTAAPVILTQRSLAVGLPSHGETVVALDEVDAFAAYPGKNLPCVSSAGGLAYVIYTSGSTGAPKGVLVDHEGVVNLVSEQDYVTVGPDDRVAALATLAFDASTFELWAPLVNGGTCVVYEFASDDLSNLVAQIERDAVTILHLTSPVFRLLEPHHFQALAGVHTILFGGDSVRSELGLRAAQHYSGNLIHLYGPTETTGFATFCDIRAISAETAQIPIGRPLRQVYVRVLDASGRAITDGTAGELYIGGRGMARGYLNRPDATAERFVHDPAGDGDTRLYRTGDRVRVGTDEMIHFEGRLDRQIKVRGFRIEPGEIEAALARHPDVRDAVVVAREDGTGDKRLDAYVVPTQVLGSDEHHALVSSVRAHIQDVLPNYQHPATLTVIATIPLTDNLKLDQASLPAPVNSRRSPSDPAAMPRTELESILTKLWMDTFGLRDVDIDDDFFELGGDSISAVHLAATAGLAAGRPISVKDVFKYPTIRQLCDAVAAPV